MYHFSFVKICQKSCSKSTSHSLAHLHTHLPGAPRLPADSSLFVWDTLLYPGQRSNIMHPVTHLDDKRGGSAQRSAAQRQRQRQVSWAFVPLQELHNQVEKFFSFGPERKKAVT